MYNLIVEDSGGYVSTEAVKIVRFSYDGPTLCVTMSNGSVGFYNTGNFRSLTLEYVTDSA